MDKQSGSRRIKARNIFWKYYKHERERSKIAEYSAENNTTFFWIFNKNKKYLFIKYILFGSITLKLMLEFLEYIHVWWIKCLICLFLYICADNNKNQYFLIVIPNVNLPNIYYELWTIYIIKSWVLSIGQVIFCTANAAMLCWTKISRYFSSFLTSVHVCALCRVTRTTTRYPGMSDSILKSSLHFRVWDELDDAIAFLFPAIWLLPSL